MDLKGESERGRWRKAGRCPGPRKVPEQRRADRKAREVFGDASSVRLEWGNAGGFSVRSVGGKVIRARL